MLELLKFKRIKAHNYQSPYRRQLLPLSLALLEIKRYKMQYR
mgnify:CR=1 FL=1